MERSRRRQAGAIPWTVALVAVCLQPINAFAPTETRAPSLIDKVRLVFHSDGSRRNTARPIEGADPFTPEDPQCLRYGYQYRVHMPTVFAGALCAVFYEDDFIGGEEILAELGFHSMVRFAVTPVAQAIENPPPDSTRGKRRISPQDYLSRGDAIERGIAAVARQEARTALDKQLKRSVL
jgi:hypothetical protein